MPGLDMPRVCVLGRPLAMAALLVLLAALTLGAMGIAVFQRPIFVARFPGAQRPIVYGAYLIGAVLTLVGLVGVWFWKQWAVVLLCALTGIVFVVDLLARAPLAHVIAGPIALALVLVAVQPVRGRFRGGARGGSPPAQENT